MVRFPLGFRRSACRIFFGLKGPMGRALKHLARRNFFLGDQVNAGSTRTALSTRRTVCRARMRFLRIRLLPDGQEGQEARVELELMFNTEEFNLNETMMMFDHNKRCFGGGSWFRV